MPLHIIKMTMIVIFVPSPPQPLLFSRVPLALPPPSSPRLPVRRVSDACTQPPSVGPVGEKREILLSPSFVRAETVRHAETGRTQKFLLVPFTLFFLLVPLIVARARVRARARARESRLTPTSLLACHSPSYRLSLARSFPVRPTIPLYPSKGFAPVCIFVIARLSARAEEGSSSRASVGRPRTAYLCSTSYTSVDNNRNFRWR